MEGRQGCQVAVVDRLQYGNARLQAACFQPSGTGGCAAGEAGRNAHTGQARGREAEQ